MNSRADLFLTINQILKPLKNEAIFCLLFVPQELTAVYV